MVCPCLRIYFKPEIAAVGLTEAQAREKHGEVVTAKYSLKGNGRAVIAREDSGFGSCGQAQREVLGVHIIGPQATELIAGAALALEQGVTLEIGRKLFTPSHCVRVD